MHIIHNKFVRSKVKKKKNKSHDKLSDLHRVYRVLSLKYYTVFKYFNLVYSFTNPNRAQMILILQHDDSFLKYYMCVVFNNMFFREFYRFQINGRTLTITDSNNY